MKNCVFWACALCALLATSSLSASMISVGALGTFTEMSMENVSGDLFMFMNTSTPNSGVRITNISLELPTDLLFDLSGSFMDMNPGSDFHMMTSPGGTISPTVGDGSKWLNLDFTDFDPGEALAFTIDVDRATGSLMEQTYVPSSAFAGTLFSVTFDGPNGPLTLANQFAPLEIWGIPLPMVAASAVSETVEVLPNPEPSSWILFSLGTVGLVYAARRRKAITG